jgi:hypothetical protein
VFFALGVFLVGVITARALHGISRLYDGWRADVGRYFDDQFEWGELRARDEKRLGKEGVEYALGYGSFGCFIVGSAFGFFSFF